MIRKINQENLKSNIKIHGLISDNKWTCIHKTLLGLKNTMVIEQIAEILIYYLHAPLGGVALISGSVSVIAKKGGRIHRKYGKNIFLLHVNNCYILLAISILPIMKAPSYSLLGCLACIF